LGVLRIFIDKALLPFKEPKVLDDDKNGGIKFALIQAEKYYENPQKNEGILSGLGGLIAAYVGVFSNLDSLSPVVKMVKGEIEGNLSNCLFSLDDYIKKLPLNYDYVRKLFKKETGITPHEYLVQSRMQLAKELILSGMSNQYSNYTISQLAEACGFSEPLYFSRVFKANFGISPALYKERSKKEQN
jgi:AraC-like DNA-binding protein